MTMNSEIREPNEVIDRLLEEARKTGLDQMDVYLVKGKSLTVAAKNRRIDQVRRTEEFAASLRLVDGERLGFAYTSVFTPDAIRKTVEEAAAGARLADPQPGLAVPKPPDSYPEVEGLEPDRTEKSIEEKMEMALEMEATALDFDPKIERVRQAEYRESEYTSWLANGYGLRYSKSRTVFSGGILVKAADGDDAEMGYDGDAFLSSAELDLKEMGRQAAERAVRRLGGRKVDSCVCPVLLENRVTTDVLDVLSGSFLASSVQKGKSSLAGKIGKKIGGSNITIIDDGTMPKGLASAPADAEGLAKQKTVLVDQGELKSFLYDHQRANVDKCISTGNAGRGAKSPPSVTTTNFYLEPGTKSFQEMADLLGTGLLVTEFMGLHTADAITGDFSLGVTGLWIKNGQIDHPVKGMALAGNLFKMLENVIEVGGDFRFFGTTGAPSLLVGGLSLGGL